MSTINMKVSSTLGCCPCSWPYFLTLSYISGRKKHSMEETLKSASLTLNSLGYSLGSPQTSDKSPSETGESLKSPNMSTDSGFEGENNRPLLLTTIPSPSKDAILNSWTNEVICRGKESLHFVDSEITSPKSPKKSLDDSDFNESPFDKTVSGSNEVHFESDNECGSEHNCAIFAPESWSDTGISEQLCINGNVGMLANQISAFSVCLARNKNYTDDKFKGKQSHIELSKCPSCHKLNFVSAEEVADCIHPIPDMRWNGRLASIHEDKDSVIYAEHELENNSEEEFDAHCKPDTETDTSDEKIFDGVYSDDTLSAYYVPSAVSTTAEDYQQPSNVLEKKVLVREIDSSSVEDNTGSLCLCDINMCKSTHCLGERSRYTTVLKPKPIWPSANSNRVEYHSSLESLHGQHVATIGQHHNRLSAFHERPSSSLSQNEGMQYFFSRSLDMPPNASSIVQSSSHISVKTGSDFLASNSCLCSIGSYNALSSLTNNNKTRKNKDTLHSSQYDCNRNSKDKLEKKSNNSAIGGDNKSDSVMAKRFSMPWDLFWKIESSRRQALNINVSSEPIHMTLEEVHSSLHILNPDDAINKSPTTSERSISYATKHGAMSHVFGSYLRQKKNKTESNPKALKMMQDSKHQKKSFPVFIRSAFNNLFGLKKSPPVLYNSSNKIRLSSSTSEDELSSHAANSKSSPNTSPFSNRALPPLPSSGLSDWDGMDEDQWTFDGSHSQLCDKEEDLVRRQMDYAASIERVKDCGWYWGPISGETAEKLLSTEPDGSFVVRDSSDEHYIFSLTFKLNGLVRHVRIEHDHGNFSFGCLQKFRSNTIVDFIDSAVAHSRSGRYLFFLHRRPVLGPMRVQLLHPVSRFKQVQSLQHLCRFVILKTIRRDLIDELPLPTRLKDYLNTPHYYSEELATLSLLSKKHLDSRSSTSYRRSSQSEACIEAVTLLSSNHLATGSG